MKQGSTLFLRLALIFIAAPVVVLCTLGLYWIFSKPVNPAVDQMIYPILIGLYVTVVPFLLALSQAWKLLSFIDKNKAFSERSVKALKKIKYYAIAISSIYVIILPFVFFLAEFDDAPGLIIVGMIPPFASMIIAVFAAVLQRLLQEAIDIKSENDLTV